MRCQSQTSVVWKFPQTRSQVCQFSVSRLYERYWAWWPDHRSSWCSRDVRHPAWLCLGISLRWHQSMSRWRSLQSRRIVWIPLFLSLSTLPSREFLCNSNLNTRLAWIILSSVMCDVCYVMCSHNNKYSVGIFRLHFRLQNIYSFQISFYLCNRKLVDIQIHFSIHSLGTLNLHINRSPVLIFIWLDIYFRRFCISQKFTSGGGIRSNDNKW